MPRIYYPPKGHKESPYLLEMQVEELLRQVDICFVMDATGSMGPYIANVRQKLKTLAQELSMHRLRPLTAFALVLYRDHPPQDRTFVTRFYPLSEHLDDIQKVFDQASAGGGGDGPEAVADGLYDALYNITWRQGAHKFIFLVGDAPPHGVGMVGDDFPEGCPCGYEPEILARQAKERGIIIFSLGVGNDSTMQNSFERISSEGEEGGMLIPLNDASKLIDKVLEKTRGEFGNIDIDRLVYRVYRPKITVAEIAKSTGLELDVVEKSLMRLRKKEMLR